MTEAVDELPSMKIDKRSLILPASLQRSDPTVEMYRRARSLAGGSTSVCIPTWRGPFDRTSGGEGLPTIRMSREVVHAQHRVALVNLDLVAQSGPFVLDLAARYLAPIDRVRVLASPQRELSIVRINQTIKFETIVLSKTIGRNRIWLETSDLIAGELLALAFSEVDLPANRRFPSPWEDPLVQRATDLELGARYAGDIRLGRVAPVRLADLNEVLLALHLRAGIDISRVSDHY